MRQRDRFVLSKCGRCGRTTPAKHNGIGELFVLPHEWGAPLADVNEMASVLAELLHTLGYGVPPAGGGGRRELHDVSAG